MEQITRYVEGVRSIRNDGVIVDNGSCEPAWNTDPLAGGTRRPLLTHQETCDNFAINMRMNVNSEISSIDSLAVGRSVLSAGGGSISQAESQLEASPSLSMEVSNEISSCTVCQ